MSDGSRSLCISGGGALGSICFEVLSPTGCPSLFFFFCIALILVIRDPGLELLI